MPDGRLLLIVEDEPTFARTLARSFERRGYRVIAASDPDEMQAVLNGTHRRMPSSTSSSAAHRD